MSFPILSLLILTPLIGALTISLSSSTQLNNRTIFISGLWITTGEFLLSLLLPIFYDQKINGYQFKEFHTWFDKFDINYYFCLLYTSPSPRDATLSRMPSSA